MSNQKKAWLLLQDGTLLTGESFGAAGTALGEVVFSTAMTGYQEALTDPNYYGQILIQTFPMMGNYGVNQEDFSGSRCYLKACIVREWCAEPSNFRCEGTIDSFLKSQGVIGLCGIDTRHLTALLRDKGTMAGMVTTQEITDRDAALKQLQDYRITGAVEAVTADWKAGQAPLGSGRRVGVLNLGHTAEAVAALAERGCTVSCHTASEGPDAFGGCGGVLLSEGPGDPAENTGAIQLIQALIEKKVPLLGIGLGHQLLALALGAKTQKLPYGHRGASQPVIDLRSGKTYPTSQNHGYTVVDLPPEAGVVSHQNVNDKTCEGIRYTGIPALSVQFRPQGAGTLENPVDTGYLFDEFLRLMD